MTAFVGLASKPELTISAKMLTMVVRSSAEKNGRLCFRMVNKNPQRILRLPAGDSEAISGINDADRSGTGGRLWLATVDASPVPEEIPKASVCSGPIIIPVKLRPAEATAASQLILPPRLFRIEPLVVVRSKRCRRNAVLHVGHLV